MKIQNGSKWQVFEGKVNLALRYKPGCKYQARSCWQPNTAGSALRRGEGRQRESVTNRLIHLKVPFQISDNIL